MGDALTKLQDWYFFHCNREWERDFGVSIGTLENPGWSLEVDLKHTPLENKNVELKRIERTEIDWILWRVENEKFIAYGGPKNLSEMIEVFFKWAEG